MKNALLKIIQKFFNDQMQILLKEFLNGLKSVESILLLWQTLL